MCECMQTNIYGEKNIPTASERKRERGEIIGQIQGKTLGTCIAIGRDGELKFIFL